MILECPSCRARYLVPASHFAGGARVVRCARCQHNWTADLPAEPALDLIEKLTTATGESGYVPGTNLPAVAQSKSFGQRWGGAIAFAVIVALCCGWFALDRRDLARKWPSLERVYDRIGLHIFHAGEGLSFQQVRSETVFDSGVMDLTVEGQIHNTTGKTQPIPDLLATAVGADGKVMQDWQIDAPAANVAAGANVAFTSTIRAPQGTVIEVNLTFIETEHVP